jgi:hypothetical protein
MDPLLKLLHFLDQVNAMDQGQKMKFFKGLPGVLPQFPKARFSHFCLYFYLKKKS